MSLKQHPFLYGPIFEAISQYLNIYDFHRFAALCKQTHYYASEYRNLIPATKALQLLKRAMKRWSFFRIITRISIANPIEAAIYAGISTPSEASFICNKINRLSRKRHLPIVHSIWIDYKVNLEDCKYRIERWSDYICNISWYFYDVEEQPTHCKLCATHGELVDENFNGVFNEPFPITPLQYEKCYLQFPDYVAGSRVYICIKFIIIIDNDARRKIALARNFWTTNNGIQCYTSNGGLYSNQYTPVKYTPAYKEIPY